MPRNLKWLNLMVLFHFILSAQTGENIEYHSDRVNGTLLTFTYAKLTCDVFRREITHLDGSHQWNPFLLQGMKSSKCWRGGARRRLRR